MTYMSTTTSLIINHGLDVSDYFAGKIYIFIYMYLYLYTVATQ